MLERSQVEKAVIGRLLLSHNDIQHVCKTMPEIRFNDEYLANIYKIMIELHVDLGWYSARKVFEKLGGGSLDAMKLIHIISDASSTVQLPHFLVLLRMGNAEKKESLPDEPPVFSGSIVIDDPLNNDFIQVEKLKPILNQLMMAFGMLYVAQEECSDRETEAALNCLHDKLSRITENIRELHEDL